MKNMKSFTGSGYSRMMKAMRNIFLAGLLILSSSPRLFAGNPPDEGMWLPLLIPRLNYVDMQKMGLHLTAEELYSINHSSLKDAIVGLAHGTVDGFFCTAEIVSDQGLLFTNHHCGYNAVQEHSTPEHDYLANGFWAMNKDEELANEGMTASFLIRMENVTDSIVPFLSDTLKESARGEKVKEISTRLKKRASENGKYDVTVKSFYAGNEYYLFVFQTYRDVRLVGAPPSSIGKFGGDTDNWMWPRHTGDFTVFRIYSDSTGNPADYSKNNTPLKPKYHLPVSLKGIKKNDFAMIWGYPGSTSRYLTSYGLEYNLNVQYPAFIKIFGKELDVMKERMDADTKVKIEYASNYAGIANYWKNLIGQTKMLVRNKVEDKKKSIENEFVAWTKKDPAREKKYGSALDDLKQGYESLNAVAKPFLYANLAGAGLDLLNFSSQFNGMTDVLKKKDKKEIQETAEKMKGIAREHFSTTDFATEKKTFSEMLKIYKNDVEKKDLPSIFNTIEVDYMNDIDAFTDDVFSKSIYTDSTRMYAFLKKPSLKVMQKDIVPIIANSMNEAVGKYLGSFQQARTKISAGNRHFIAGLREMDANLVKYPDANSTMRMTYGSVLDYFPADAVHYDYYTTLKGVMQKEDPNNEEFIVEKKLKDLYEAKDYGQYGENGEMVTCFLTTNDITGGNSGSPVINADGQLIGLAFDGNWEAMSGDISFEPDLQRTICVDIRYVLFIIDKFAGDKNLINELTIVK
ncbi:MAG: S46 family peptidase [Bacteroidota bacterium]|nr:S46 family peptidase [Bacteroidota bacterium]